MGRFREILTAGMEPYVYGRAGTNACFPPGCTVIYMQNSIEMATTGKRTITLTTALWLVLMTTIVVPEAVGHCVLKEVDDACLLEVFRQGRR